MLHEKNMLRYIAALHRNTSTAGMLAFCGASFALRYALRALQSRSTVKLGGEVGPAERDGDLGSMGSTAVSVRVAFYLLVSAATLA